MYWLLLLLSAVCDATYAYSLKTLNLQHNWFNSLGDVSKPRTGVLEVIDLRNNPMIKNIQKYECEQWTETRIKLLLSSPLSCLHCDIIGWVWPIKQGNYATFNSCINPDNDGLLCAAPALFKDKSIFQPAALCLHEETELL